MNKLPETAKRFNAWLLNTFQCLDGADTSYLSFPFEFGFDGQQFYTEHRIVFSTLSLKGAQDYCCKEIAIDLLKLPAHELIQDRCCIIFLRKEFSYQEDYLSGRLAFWDNKLNDKLKALRCFHVEGAHRNNVLIPED